MSIRDLELYRPLFSPWLGGQFARLHAIASPRTIVTADRCYVLCTLLSQAIHSPGDIWECGVYRGGTAAMMAALIHDSRLEKSLFLFDTFCGMPESDPSRDVHAAGDFSDTCLAEVAEYVGHSSICHFRPGRIPGTFAGLEDRGIAFAHIDLDLYRSIQDTLVFLWPRLVLGGILVFDDYGFPTCPGARDAIDEFFENKHSRPLCLPTGQAVVFKGIS